MKVVIIRVLIECHKGVGSVTRVEDFTGAKVDLENRGSARDRAGNRHVGHNFLRG